MTPLHSVHVVPHIDDEASGPSYSVPSLCRSLSAQGHRVGLMCLRSATAIPGVELEVFPQWPFLSRFAVSPRMGRALRDQAANADIIHNHSLWSMANVAAGWAVPGARAKLVTSPRGTLSPWALANSRRVKRLVWPLQARALTRADLLHATSEQEHDEIRALGLTAPVVVVPNGIDMPLLPKALDRLQAHATGHPRTLLFLSRIHPKKGIDRLLVSWSRLHARFPEWRLVVAGSGETAHIAEVALMAESLRLPRVHFPGPIYGSDKSQAYASAELFVLPTHSENFGMVVAEALAHGCPAIVSRGAPWEGLGVHRCGWWVDHDTDALTTALGEAMAMPVDALAEAGRRGQAWMARDYGWSSVAARLSEAYTWLARGGAEPESLRLWK